MNQVQEIRLDAEIRLGEEIIRLKGQGEIRAKDDGLSKKGVVTNDTLKLSDYGITAISSRGRFPSYTNPSFFPSFLRTWLIMRETVALLTGNSFVISAWLFSPERIILMASVCCSGESL